MLAYRGIGEKSLEQRFMIALERDVGCRKRVCHETIEHTARRRPSVDIVAERDRQRAGTMFFDIAFDRGDHTVK